MKDYSMALAKIAANIIVDVMGNTLTAETYYSADGNDIITEFRGYPLYGQNKTGTVFWQYPRSTFYVRKKNVCITPIQQSQCRYFQEFIGKQFAHPHVFTSGIPCWDKSSRERVPDYLASTAETLTLQNVTRDSVLVGICASGVMGVRLEALENAEKHQKKVLETLKCKPIVTDHRKLESYITKRWSSMITVLTNAQ